MSQFILQNLVAPKLSSQLILILKFEVKQKNLSNFHLTCAESDKKWIFLHKQIFNHNFFQNSFMKEGFLLAEKILVPLLELYHQKKRLCKN